MYIIIYNDKTFNKLISNMVQKINFLKRDQAEKLHTQIISEYSELLDISDGKNKQKILEKLAKKYGYSSGQAVRNMMNNHKKQLA